MNHTNVLEQVMTVAEVSSEFGVHPSGVRATCERGSVAARKSTVGDVWLISRADAERQWGKQESEMMAAKVETSVFKARELEAGAKGWRVSVYYPGELFDERGWPFRLKREAQEFARRVKVGEQPRRVYDEMMAR